MKNTIGRFLLKDYLTFDKVDLNFETNGDNNLILFTGSSGAGKSILLKSIVSNFGNVKDVLAGYSEIEILKNSIPFESSSLKGEKEDFIIKYIKEPKLKFFIDDKTISKSKLSEYSSSFVKHLHLKDVSEFESKNFINTVDSITTKNNPDFSDILNQYKLLYKEYSEINTKINTLIEEEKNIEDLKEFLEFEIKKIETINPLENELEELKETKKKLSEKDFIEEKINKVREVMDNLNVVEEFLSKLDIDTSLYDEFNSFVFDKIETFNDGLEELEELDIESILDRISELSGIVRKYGSIEGCLEELKNKKEKLAEYQNISFTKEHLIKRKDELKSLLSQETTSISRYRKETIEILIDKINYYLKFLYLDGANIQLIETKDFNSQGKNEIKFELNCVDLETISSGEFNRLRLALLTTKTDFDLENGGILFLDEIDANLSGKESESIAKVVTKLAKHHQVFAISHQPQLTSQADMHFLVEKTSGKSSVRLLNMEERSIEISRMISGENITEEAKIFAEKLLKNKH